MMRLLCYASNNILTTVIGVDNQSDEVNGLGSVSVWSGGMDIKEIG